MLCLAIETSCDDTSVAILHYSMTDTFENIVSTTKVLSSCVSSQIEIHAIYGGVIPEIGARYHTTNFLPVMTAAINEASGTLNITHDDLLAQLDFIAVTTEPGLHSALKVGIEEAKALSYFLKLKFNRKVPIQFVNHLHGHIASSFLENGIVDSSPFPHLHLLVSGGNTQILKINNWNDINIIAKTVDDAVGECYDKTARMIGFQYPGGVSLARIAGMDNTNYLGLNRAMLNDSLNMSYSGLKTQVRYIIQQTKIQGVQYEVNMSNEDRDYLINTGLGDVTDPRLEFLKKLCISIQQVCTEQLVRKIKLALKNNDLNSKIISFGLSGGVSANLLLREECSKIGKYQLHKPQLKYTGDNAAMIGLAGILDKYLLK
jgi:N6-L-threonylcarbamoyladenine synthase